MAREGKRAKRIRTSGLGHADPGPRQAVGAYALRLGYYPLCPQYALEKVPGYDVRDVDESRYSDDNRFGLTIHQSIVYYFQVGERSETSEGGWRRLDAANSTLNS
jgi:hypothetical protein